MIGDEELRRTHDLWITNYEPYNLGNIGRFVHKGDWVTSDGLLKNKLVNFVAGSYVSIVDPIELDGKSHKMEQYLDSTRNLDLRFI